MIFKLFIDKDCREEVIANVHRRTPLIDEIERLCSRDDRPDQLPGYLGDEITMLEISGIECFVVENEKTFAVCGKNKYLVRKRLY